MPHLLCCVPRREYTVVTLLVYQVCRVDCPCSYQIGHFGTQETTTTTTTTSSTEALHGLDDEQSELDAMDDDTRTNRNSAEVEDKSKFGSWDEWVENSAVGEEVEEGQEVDHWTRSKLNVNGSFVPVGEVEPFFPGRRGRMPAWLLRRVRKDCEGGLLSDDQTADAVRISVGKCCS